MELKFKIFIIVIIILICIYYKKSYKIENFKDDNIFISLNYIKYIKPIIGLKKKPQKILILGGGDLFGVSMLLKYNFIQSIIVIDKLKSNDFTDKITNDKRLTVIDEDPLQYLDETEIFYDIIFDDLKIDISKNLYYLTYLRNCFHKTNYYIRSVKYSPKKNKFKFNLNKKNNYKKTKFKKVNIKFNKIIDILNIKKDQVKEFTDLFNQFLNIYVDYKYFPPIIGKNNNIKHIGHKLFYIIETNYEKRKNNYHNKSKIQSIDFVYDNQNKNFGLFLNGEIQFNSNEYFYSHYINCIIPLLKYKPKNILILGGGDLISAGMILKYDFVEKLTVVELDPGMIRMCKINHVMRKVSNNALQDKRINVFIGDGIKYILETKNKYDMLIEDMEVDFTTIKQSSNLRLLRSCIEKSKIFVTSDDLDGKYLKKLKVIAEENINKNYDQIKYYKPSGNKLKIFEELGNDKKEIEQLGQNIINNLDIFVTSYFCKPVVLHNKKYNYGVETYGYIINKLFNKNYFDYFKKSKYQNIEFIQNDKDFVLTLNQETQVHSKEYYISHYIQCNIPVSKFKPKNVLILGGGDLIAASFILEDPSVELVTLVELDVEMINMVKNVPKMMEITNNVIYSKKLKIIISDGISFIENTENFYDLIIDDMELDWTSQVKNRKINFLKNCINKSKIVAITTIDVDIYEKKIKYSVLNNYLDNEKNYEDTKYEKYNGSKEKILKDLRYKKREIKQLDKDLLKDLNFYVTAREYPTIKINNLSFEYGFEGYVLIENKKNINSNVINDKIL